jgi:hypothetical protein
MARLVSLACAAGSLIALSCTTYETEPRLSAASGVTTPNARTVDRITAARCAREEHCNNVAVGRKYETLDACQREMRDSAYEALSPERCPAAIDPAQVNDCLAAIEDEQCGQVIDTIERVAACHPDSLCPD